MIKMLILLAGLLFTGNNVFAQNIAMQVQLPFVDGAYFRCVQNSDDTPTHQGQSTKRDLDFGMDVGNIIVAAADGVMHWGSNPGGFGTYAKVDHGNGYWTMYGHLSGYIAQAGDTVVAGQPIAYSGNTGNSTGPHIHFGVHQGSSVGESVSMDIYALDRSSGILGWLSTGTETDFVCDESVALKNGRYYESRPIGNIFSDYQCRTLASSGILCWSGNPTTCEDGDNHVWYHKNSDGANISEHNSITWQKCFEGSGQGTNVFSYLNGGYGIGGGGGPGYETLATDSAIPNLPDFIVRKTWIETPWGVESYKYGLGESFELHAQSKNIGSGSCSGDITGHVYLSDGYNEDAHSGDNAWRRINTSNTQCSDLGQGETHTETETTILSEWITNPGIYNIVYCIDHPQDDHNNGGDHPEEHESNNCSTEAVFEVTSDNHVNLENCDLVITAVSLVGPNPVTSDGTMNASMTIQNQGEEAPSGRILSSYSILGPGTNGQWQQIADDGTDSDQLAPGMSNIESIITPVPAPTVPGLYSLRACADYQDVIAEIDETNNCATVTFRTMEAGTVAYGGEFWDNQVSYAQGGAQLAVVSGSSFPEGTALRVSGGNYQNVRCMIDTSAMNVGDKLTIYGKVKTTAGVDIYTRTNGFSKTNWNQASFLANGETQIFALPTTITADDLNGLDFNLMVFNSSATLYIESIQVIEGNLLYSFPFLPQTFYATAFSSISDWNNGVYYVQGGASLSRVALSGGYALKASGGTYQSVRKTLYNLPLGSRLLFKGEFKSQSGSSVFARTNGLNKTNWTQKEIVSTDDFQSFSLSAEVTANDTSGMDINLFSSIAGAELYVRNVSVQYLPGDWEKDPWYIGGSSQIELVSDSSFAGGYAIKAKNGGYQAVWSQVFGIPIGTALTVDFQVKSTGSLPIWFRTNPANQTVWNQEADDSTGSAQSFSLPLVVDSNASYYGLDISIFVLQPNPAELFLGKVDLNLE